MNISSRLNKINNKLNTTKGMRLRKLEDCFLGTMENTYVPKPRKGEKRLEDYFK